MKNKRRRILPRADINVTRFIDILLVLLVIFMTISPTKPLGLKAEVPQPPPPVRQTEGQNTAIVLSMDRNGVIKIDQDEVGSVRLVGRLQDIFKSRSDRTVFLEADNDLLFNDVAQLDRSRQGRRCGTTGPDDGAYFRQITSDETLA